MIVGLTLSGVFLFSSISTDSPSNSYDGEVIVYETEVESGDDCTSYEEYDAEAQVCYFECANDDECDEILAEIDAELESWTDILEDQDRAFEEEVTGEENYLASYSVYESEQIELSAGVDSSEYEELWQEIADLSPDTLSDEFIEEFAVYSDESSGTLAYVVDEDFNGKWLIAINLATHKSTSIREQKSTIIHELSHILTLNSSQVLTAYDSCDTYELDIGCATDASYLYSFYDMFWRDSSDQTFRSDTFVTEYATTNTEEDLAESFSFFILERSFSDATMRDQKVNFFNQYPELVSIRSDMRQVLAKEIVRERRQN